MPTIVTHAIMGAGAAVLFALPMRQLGVRTVATLGAAAGSLPDIDFISLIAGIPYANAMGHRGITHSIAAAAVVATILAAVVSRRSKTFRVDRPFQPIGGDVLWLWAGLAAAGVTHVLADMMTNGGLGIAIFAPFSWKRHFLPATPIPVSPLALTTETGGVILWEIVHLWPAAVAATAGVMALKRRSS